MKSYLLILSLLVSCSLNAQKKNLNLSKWHHSDKIEASDYNHIKKAKLFFSLSNDNDYLYIDLKAEDHEAQNRILKNGLTIWINMDGRELKKMGIRFPLGSDNQGSRRKADSHDNISTSDRNILTPLSMANTIELLGFTNEQQRRFPSNNHDSFRGWVRYGDDGILYYQLVVPIEKLPVRNSRDGRSAMPFTLGIEYGSSPTMNSQVNRGPKPSSVFRPRSSDSGSSEVNWIDNFKLASSK